MSHHYLTLLLVGGLACATESFETVPTGALSSAPVEYGALSAEPGHAEILPKLARTGSNALHIQGGVDRTVRLELAAPCTTEAQLNLWIERWTDNGGFDFRIIAETPKGDVLLTRETKLKAGSYNRLLSATVPAGCKAVRLVCTSNAKGGVLADDLELISGAMQVAAAELVNPGAQPMLKHAPINPVFSYKLTTKGVAQPLHVESIRLKITPADAVDSVTLRTGNNDRSADGTNGIKFRKGRVFGQAKPGADGTVTVLCSGALASGENELWVDARPSAAAKVGSKVTIESCGVQVGGKVYADKAAPVTQRVGVLLAVPDEEVVNPTRHNEIRDCKTYRIPGLIRTQAGTLLACFDARYENHLDLSADIDVAVSRSEDGGMTWSKPSVAMDAGPGKANGCGDPCILQDTKSGRIWIQALATHFDKNPCLWASTTGHDPATTGQWEMVYSDDDGKTWSPIVNATEQVKKHEWTLILAGPGRGICTGKGVLVFPAQIWNLKANPISRSTICYSTDGGKNWKFGTGVPHRTSECQVAELSDGSLMLTCRNETFQGKRVIYTTKDLGETWQPHPTNTNTLTDPACQASLVTIDSKKYGRVMLYSHPNSRPKLRNHMTVHASTDEGMTWNAGLVYDVRECWGYSCIAPIDDETIGIIYEPAHVSETNDYHGMGFLRIPLSEVMESTPTGK